MKSAIRELDELAKRRGLLDPTWILEAESSESMPLFGNIRDMTFLSSLGRRERIQLVVEYALGLLVSARRALEADVVGTKPTFCCLEFDGADILESGEALVPFVSLLAIPDWTPGREPKVQRRLGEWCKMVAAHVPIGPRDVHVLEGLDLEPIAYLGLSHNECVRFRSFEDVTGRHHDTR